MQFAKFVVKRFLNLFIAFTVIVIMYATVLNAPLDVTARGQIRDTITLMMKNEELMKGKTVEEVQNFRRDTEKRLEKIWDLDKPLLHRIITRAYKGVLLDFGDSELVTTSVFRHYSNDVKEIIAEHLPPTLILFGSTSLLAVLLSIILGVLKAQYANGRFDRITSLLMMVFYGTPSWWIGSIFVIVFVTYLHWLPFGSLYSSPPPDGAVAIVLDRLAHMILPLASVVIVRFWGSAYLIKYMLLEPLQQDYIMAARGRGIPESKIMYGHALRAASPGIVTMSVLTIVGSLGGDIMLEKILAWPGLGLLFWKAIHYNDVPLMMGILTMLTVVYCVAIFILEMIYGLLDPRIQYKKP